MERNLQLSSIELLFVVTMMVGMAIAFVAATSASFVGFRVGVVVIAATSLWSLMLGRRLWFVVLLVCTVLAVGIGAAVMPVLVADTRRLFDLAITIQPPVLPETKVAVSDCEGTREAFYQGHFEREEVITEAFADDQGNALLSVGFPVVDRESIFGARCYVVIPDSYVLTATTPGGTQERISLRGVLGDTCPIPESSILNAKRPVIIRIVRELAD